MKANSILVTGGGGFIGSNLCEELLADGMQVKCLDDFSTGLRENIERLLDNPNFTLIVGDIRNAETCSAACEGVDAVVHLAAAGSVPRSFKEPDVITDINVVGFIRVAKAAESHGVKKFVYASSSAVYGANDAEIKCESLACMPISPYGITKYANELYAGVFSNNSNMPMIGLRFFNVFGKRQNPKSQYAAVIPLFISAVLADGTSTIYGDGTQARDFTHVDNVVHAIKSAIAADTERHVALNVACGDRTSVNDLFDAICKLCGKDGKRNYVNNRPGDIYMSLASVALAKETIGYSPVINLHDGLIKTIKWYKS